VYDVYVTRTKEAQVDPDISDVRVPVSTRISPAGVREIEDMAAAENRTRSTMIRILLQEAVARRRRAAR
jgi:hypothetical protein